ncbi:MAG: hypothetical protein ACRBB6_07805 [Neptuniibacter sp.]
MNRVIRDPSLNCRLAIYLHIDTTKIRSSNYSELTALYVPANKDARAYTYKFAHSSRY